MGTMVSVFDFYIVIYLYVSVSVTNYNNPASLACELGNLHHTLLLLTSALHPVVSWTIPFTAVATSVAAIITQFFLGHRLVI
jgi:hypothetical protein